MAAIGACRTGVGVRVIRRRPGLFRPANEGCGVEGRQSRDIAEVALALRPMWRRAGEGTTLCNKRIPAWVWTGYAAEFRFVRQRAKNQNTLGVMMRTVWHSAPIQNTIN